MILRRLEGSPFSEIVREWEGETVALLGGGPSLTRELFALVEGAHRAGRLRCIAVNDSYLFAPFADVLYAADADWHAKHRAGVSKPEIGFSAGAVAERYAGFAGPMCSVEDQMDKPGKPVVLGGKVHVLRTADFLIEPTYSMPTGVRPQLVAGRNSLHQALNLAIRAGVKRCLLLGCDGGPQEIDGKQVTHFHGGHAGKPISPLFWDEMRKSFSASERDIAALGVSVINCSPGTRIDSFPKMPLGEVLAL